uniref:Uncharacterized protein n=1 Tax=Knipowitschia caucasica TaxID=637954 RepID=A0AAV2M4N6_KNICA
MWGCGVGVGGIDPGGGGLKGGVEGGGRLNWGRWEWGGGGVGGFEWLWVGVGGWGNLKCAWVVLCEGEGVWGGRDIGEGPVDVGVGGMMPGGGYVEMHSAPTTIP